MKIKVEIKNFALDSQQQEPVAVLQEINGTRTVHVPLNAFDLPKILASFYKLREDKNDLLHIFYRMERSGLIKTIRIKYLKRTDLVCVVTFRLFFLFYKKYLISPSDGILLSLINHIPIFVSKNAFELEKIKEDSLSAYDEIQSKSILEKWDPNKSNVHLQ